MLVGCLSASFQDETDEFTEIIRDGPVGVAINLFLDTDYQRWSWQNASFAFETEELSKNSGQVYCTPDARTSTY